MTLFGSLLPTGMRIDVRHARIGDDHRRWLGIAANTSKDARPGAL